MPLLTVVAVISTTLAAEPRPRLAVMPLEAKRLDQELVSILDTLLAPAVDKVGRYEVISPADIDALLGMEKLKESLGCSSVTCAAEIGGALGVDTMLAGNVSRLGKKLLIQLSLVDTKRASVVARGGSEVEANEDLYADAVRQAVADLFKLAPPPPTAVSLPKIEESVALAPTPAPPAGFLAAPLADDGWAWEAGFLGITGAAAVTILSLISEATKEETSPSLPLGALATLTVLTLNPAVASGADSSSTPSTSPGLRATSWLAYTVSMVVASGLLLNGLADGPTPGDGLITLTGLSGAGALLCMSLDAFDRTTDAPAGEAAPGVHSLLWLDRGGRAEVVVHAGLGGAF